jgi:class 3 adenylate cyclase
LKSVDQANNTRSGGGKLSVTSTAGIAEGFDEVSILFADVVGFTTYSSHISPEELVLFLNELFTCFDDIAEELGLEKIKTIGDAYMAVAGLEHGHDAAAAAAAAARMGLRVVELMMSGQFRDHENRPLEARVGIHTGSCVAGVIGRKKFIYDIWGDAVNTASRMESTGETNRVHCSEHTAFLLQGEFELETRGEIEVKGKGSMTTYFITE